MDNELNQDAIVESSATEVNETQETVNDTQGNSSQPEGVSASTSAHQDANQGAAQMPPYQNLVAEAVRKSQEALLPELRAIKEAMGSIQQAKQADEIKYEGYSKTQLEQIKKHPQATEDDKLFAVEGLAYIRSRQDTLADLNTRQAQQSQQMQDQAALQSIVSDYPEVFNRATGQWNFANPLWQRAMAVYNSNKAYQSNGNMGLRAAMDSAYAAMAREGQVKITKSQVQLNSKQRQLDKSQSQAMSAGTLQPGRTSGAETPKAKIMEAWKKNPNSEEAKKAAMVQFIPKSWLA